MDSLDVAKVAVRRWYVFVPVVAMAVVLGFRYAGAQPSSYTGDTAFTLIGAPAPTNLSPGQPDPRSLNRLGNTSQLMLVLAGDLNSAQTQQLARSKGAPLPFVAAQSTRGPAQLHITVVGSNAAAVNKTLQVARGLVPIRTAAVQDAVNAPANGQLTPLVSIPPAVVQDASASKSKMLIAFGAVGIVAGAALAILLEWWLQARRRREALDQRRRETDVAALSSGDEPSPFDLESADGHESDPLEIDMSKRKPRQMTSGGSTG